LNDDARAGNGLYFGDQTKKSIKRCRNRFGSVFRFVSRRVSTFQCTSLFVEFKSVKEKQKYPSDPFTQNPPREVEGGTKISKERAFTTGRNKEKNHFDLRVHFSFLFSIFATCSIQSNTVERRGAWR
jgi:hypothetical protein